MTVGRLCSGTNKNYKAEGYHVILKGHGCQSNGWLQMSIFARLLYGDHSTVRRAPFLCSLVFVYRFPCLSDNTDCVTSVYWFTFKDSHGMALSRSTDHALNIGLPGSSYCHRLSVFLILLICVPLVHTGKYRRPHFTILYTFIIWYEA